MFFYAHIGKIACLGDWVWAWQIVHSKNVEVFYKNKGIWFYGSYSEHG